MARSSLQRRAHLLQVFLIVQSGLGTAKAFAEAYRKVLLTAVLIGVGETRKELLRLLFLCLELRNQLLHGPVPPLGYVLGVSAIRAARKNESGVHRLPGDDGAYDDSQVIVTGQVSEHIFARPTLDRAGSVPGLGRDRASQFDDLCRGLPLLCRDGLHPRRKRSRCHD